MIFSLHSLIIKESEGLHFLFLKSTVCPWMYFRVHWKWLLLQFKSAHSVVFSLVHEWKMQKNGQILWGSSPPEKPPKGVNEKNGNGLKTPLYPHFLEKNKHTFLQEFIFNFQPPKMHFLGFKFKNCNFVIWGNKFVLLRIFQKFQWFL